VTRGRVIAAAAWIPALGCAAFALLRLSGLQPGFPLYSLLAFTPYLVPVALLVALWALLLRTRAAAILAAIAALVALALVAPRAFDDEQPAAAGAEQVRLLTMNLAIGGADVDQLAELARSEDADAVFLQELTPQAAARLRASSLGEAMPNQVLDPRDGAFGSGLITRLPLRQLPQPPFAGDRPTAAALLDAGDGAWIRAWSIHPSPPLNNDALADLDAYLDGIPAADPSGPPAILAGDFNSTLDHPDFRAVLDRGYHDAADSLGEGLVPTWPTDLFPPKVTIDHVLGDDRVGFADLSVHDVAGSDHRAVVVTATVAPG